jgi:thioesterase domain-containing protein
MTIDAHPKDDREARLAASRSRLTPEQQALLEQRLRARSPKPEAPASPASLVAIQPAGRRPPFFCVHPAGGDVLCFQPLSQHMGTDQPFYGLQSRGLSPGEEPVATIEEMAAAYRAEIVRVSAGPYHLGGWSLGGAVAYEVARQLAAEGKEVALVAVIDTTPGLPAEEVEDEDEEADDARWLLDIADYLERLWGLKLGLSPETLRGLSADEQARRFLTALQGTSFAPAGAGTEPLSRLLRVFKANVRAFRQYRPGSYPGTVTLFRPAVLLSPEEAPADPMLGWGALSPRPVAVESVPGDHISALAEPHVRTLAARLLTSIDRAAGLDTAPRIGETPRTP